MFLSLLSLCNKYCLSLPDVVLGHSCAAEEHEEPCRVSPPVPVSFFFSTSVNQILSRGPPSRPGSEGKSPPLLSWTSRGDSEVGYCFGCCCMSWGGVHGHHVLPKIKLHLYFGLTLWFPRQMMSQVHPSKTNKLDFHK